jgi:hypothetical protein
MSGLSYTSRTHTETAQNKTKTPSLFSPEIFVCSLVFNSKHVFLRFIYRPKTGTWELASKKWELGTLELRKTGGTFTGTWGFKWELGTLGGLCRTPPTTA